MNVVSPHPMKVSFSRLSTYNNDKRLSLGDCTQGRVNNLISYVLPGDTFSKAPRFLRSISFSGTQNTTFDSTHYPLSVHAKKAIIESQIATVCRNVEDNDYYGFAINVTNNAHKRLLEIDLGETQSEQSLENEVTNLIVDAIREFDDQQTEHDVWPSEVILIYHQGKLMIKSPVRGTP